MRVFFPFHSLLTRCRGTAGARGLSTYLCSIFHLLSQVHLDPVQFRNLKEALWLPLFPVGSNPCSRGLVIGDRGQGRRPHIAGHVQSFVFQARGHDLFLLSISKGGLRR